MDVQSDRPTKTMFASDGLVEHVTRGAIGLVALSCAISISGTHPAYSLALGVVSLLAFRGCPICWTIGLLETAYRRLTHRSTPP